MATRAAQEIIAAVQAGDASLIHELLKVEPELIHSKTVNGISLVLLAVYYGHSELVNLLLNQGIKLNLFEASATGKLSRVINIIKEQPELVNTYAPDGFTALGLAAFFGHHTIVEYLIKHGAEVNLSSKNPQKVQPLHSAVASRQIAIAESLLAAGANPNAAQMDDFTPLHGAAQNGDVEMLGLLLQYGASPSSKSIAGKTPRDLAKEAGYIAAVKLLTF